jgi:biotin-[acetyl-CoA-carboxylase] ligase BirA-like protein
VWNEKILYWDGLDSTVPYAESWIDGLCEKTRVWIRASAQMQGRGQWGRSFVSPRGGLYCTLILPWSFAVPPCFVSLLTSLSIADALPVACCVKWVNDLYVQGRKMGGVLVESRKTLHNTSVLLISFGLNVNTLFHLLSDVGATSLAQVMGYSVDMQCLFDKIRHCLYARVHQVIDQGTECMLRDIYPLLMGWQEKVCVTTLDNKRVEGVWTGIDTHTGQVILNDKASYWARSIVPVSGAS